MAMENSAKRVLRFERFCLDLGRGALRAGDEEIALRPKSFEVLSYLASHAGRLVTKQELDDAVWPNVSVTDASLAQCIRELRDKLEDTQRTLLKTVHRRGYILDVVVTECSSANQSTAELPASSPASIGDDAIPVSATTIETGLPSRSLGSIRSWGAAVGLLGLLLAIDIYFQFGHAPISWLSAAPVLPSGQFTQVADLATFKDCDECPEMVVLPRSGKDSIAAVSPSQRAAMRITLSDRIAVGRFEVTVAQFEAFVAQTNHPVAASCMIGVGSGPNFKERVPASADFRRPGVDVGRSHPVSCVNWYDAKAYVAWLERKTGKLYRLPTDLEWEYAARAGSVGTFSFSGGAGKACEYARFADLDSLYPQASSCRSGNLEPGPLPVGALKPNAWGLHDVHGNVWEWVEDCALGNLGLALASASLPVRKENCEIGIARGGGFGSSLWRTALSFRLDPFPVLRHQTVGFRVALTID
jgi:formylglycine-generating enzyme